MLLILNQSLSIFLFNLFIIQFIYNLLSYFYNIHIKIKIKKKKNFIFKKKP